jgi:hypothetical protein
LLLTEYSPRNAANQLAREKHRKRGREDGNEDGATHSDHCTAVDTLRSVTGLGEAVYQEADDLSDTGGVVDSSLPIGRNEKLSFGSHISETLEERGLTVKRVDLWNQPCTNPTVVCFAYDPQIISFHYQGETENAAPHGRLPMYLHHSLEAHCLFFGGRSHGFSDGIGICRSMVNSRDLVVL